jgi:putative resolvase
MRAKTVETLQLKYGVSTTLDIPSVQMQLLNPASTEQILEAIIRDEYKLEYTKNFSLGPYSFDFYIPKCNLLIECQGDYFHKFKEFGYSGTPVDRAKSSFVENNTAYKLIWIYEHEINLGRIRKILGYQLGKIKTTRTASNYRVIPLSEIKRIQDSGTSDKITLAYCRVSTRKQSENLERQVGRVLEYCAINGLKVELFKDIGSGLNENRKEFNKLINRISEGDVSRVIIEYRDRLTRFGFQTFEEYCRVFGTEIVSLETKPNKSFEEELSEDLISIITCYSARLYGRRSHKK